jgi:hypothetical protein
MTKRKDRPEKYSRLELAQYRLRRMAKLIDLGIPLEATDKKFLADALWAIGRGEDANEVFEVKAARGERKTKANASRADNAKLALSWIAAAIAPEEEGGLGLSLDEAFEKAAEQRDGGFNCGLSEESLRSLWQSQPELRSRQVARPLHSFPDRGR